MAKQRSTPYVTKRNGTLYYRRRVPRGAEQRFGGRTEFVRTLKATSVSAAQPELAVVIAEYEALARRPAASGQVTVASRPAEALVLDQALADRLARQQLETIRFMNSGALAGVDPSQFEVEARSYRTAAVAERQLLKQSAIPEPWRLAARGAIRQLDIDPDKHSGFVEQVARVFGELRAEYWMERAYELEGEPTKVNNEALFGRAAYAKDGEKSADVSVAEAVRRFLANPLKEIAPSSLQQYRPRMKVIEEAFGSAKPLRQVTRSDCRRLVEDVILKLPSNYSKKYPGVPLKEAIAQGARDGAPLIAIATQRLYVEMLKSFLLWAERDELIEASPARNLVMPKGRDLEPRAAFSSDQLNAIFSAPLYSGCKDDGNGYATPGRRKPRGARFWIPLIALYSGMRLDEIAQLRCRDIANEWNVDFFNLVEDQAAGRTLKTKGSARRVPVHPMLKKIGLLKYARALPQSGDLFPDLVARSKNPGDVFGKWFGNFCNSIELTDRRLVFHSFRHTFATGCRACGISREQVEAIGGWSYGGTSGGYGHQSLPGLAAAIARLEYPGLALGHLYKR